MGFDFTQSYYNTTINESSGFIDIDNSLRINSISINTDKTGIANIHNWTFNMAQSSYDIKNDTLVLTRGAYEIVEYIRTMLQTTSGVFIIRVMNMNTQKLLELTIFIDYQA